MPQVIKIEQPGRGDDTRHFAPFCNGESAYYMNLNRGKQGVTLDLKSRPRPVPRPGEDGRRGGRELPTRARWTSSASGYDTLKAVNPRLVYAAVSGFGDTGPYRLRPGYDIIAQAMGGLMSTTGWPGGEPTRSGTAMADVLAGLSVTIGLLAALRHRDRTGEGQKVDVALVDSVVASLEIITQIYLTDGRVPERIGNRYESCYPYDSFAARDGSVVIAAANDKLWRLVCRTIGQPELADDERFDTNAKRVERHAEIKPLIEAWSRERDVDAIVEAMLGGRRARLADQHDRPAGDRPAYRRRPRDVRRRRAPGGGQDHVDRQSHQAERHAARMSRAPAPRLGEHNDEVFQNLPTMTTERLSRLRAEGVV